MPCHVSKPWADTRDVGTMTSHADMFEGDEIWFHLSLTVTRNAAILMSVWLPVAMVKPSTNGKLQRFPFAANMERKVSGSLLAVRLAEKVSGFNHGSRLAEKVLKLFISKRQFIGKKQL